MTAQAILPRNVEDPTGQDKRERDAMNQMDRRCRGILRGMLDILKRQEYTTAEVNHAEQSALVLNWAIEDGLDEAATNDLWMHYNATEYRFLLDTAILGRINEEIGNLVDEWLLEGGPSDLWYTNAYVEPAYIQGTAQAMTNLGVQSELYNRARPTIESVVMSEPYRRRIGLVRARVFEEMKGLTDAMKGDLGSTLARGMAAGLNPLTIAKDIQKRVDVSASRARTIARTEITTALKNARLDEDQSAMDDLGLRLKQMQFSALSPTTRASHAARHGNLYTISEVKEWMSRPGESINCKCSFISTLVDEKGKPYNDGAIRRAKKLKEDKGF